MCNHIVVDIETLSTEANAVILSVAFVLVDTSYAVGAKQGIKDSIVFYPSLADQKSLNRHSSVSTVKWWDAQSDEAKDAVNVKNRSGFERCMRDMFTWLERYDCSIWGNGSDFDNVILANAFSSVGLKWPFWHNRCLRTLKNITQEIYPDIQFPDFKGFKHVALDDALHEARILTLCLSYLKGRG